MAAIQMTYKQVRSLAETVSRDTTLLVFFLSATQGISIKSI